MTPAGESMTESAASRFLVPEVLARIGNLELLARTVVEGFLSGLHRSPYRGRSTDFAEHRGYTPGDDIRRIDWRLFGRTDRHYVKEFEADTNTNFLVVLDVSASMRYRGESGGPGGVNNLTYGCYLAAALAYFSSLQRDRVGLVTFDADIVEYVPPSAKHLQLVLHALQRAVRSAEAESQWSAGEQGRRKRSPRAESGGSLVPVMRKLGESLRRRSIVLLISDLYEEADDVMNALTFLRGRGNDVIVSHVLDHDELSFPFTDAGSFVDLESRVALPVIPDYLRKEYRALVAAHTAELARRSRNQRLDYALYDTARPLDQALFAYLSARQRFSRVR